MTMSRPLIAVAVLFVAVSLLAGDPPATERKLKNRAHQKLAGANLKGNDLRDTDLAMTDLRGADLSGADLTGAKLDRTELADADLRGVMGLKTVDFGFGVNAKRADFRDTDLRDVGFRGTYFEGADFRGADLRGAILVGRFHDAKFGGADVRGTVMLTADGTEPLHADLQARGAITTAADFARTVQDGRDYSDCYLHGVPLPRVNLDDGKFDRADLHSADLRGASLRRARSNGTLFNYAKLAGADLTAADLTATHFIGADLTGADLSNADCRGADFGGAKLNGAKFVGGDLSGVHFGRADLTGADLTGSSRDGVRWEAAVTADLRGVTPEEQKAITEQAARWRYDLHERFGQCVRNFSLPVWALAWPLGAVGLAVGGRRVPRHPSLRILMAFHALAVLPAAVLAFMCCCGVSPVVQLSGSLNGWSAWVHVFPLAVGILLVGLVAFLPATVTVWVVAFRRPAPGLRPVLALATLFAGLSLVAAVGVVVVLAPSA
jgi:uncharacterized protein YjbI with pentapeptide repeats